MERNLTLSLEKAREWYRQGKPLREVALQLFTEDELNLPKTWLEWIEKDKSLYQLEATTDTYQNIVSCTLDETKILPKNKEEAINVLRRLLILRDTYRRGWKPNTYLPTNAYKVQYKLGEWIVAFTTCTSFIFTFQSEEIAQMFLDNFKDELEQLKDLL